ncbi:MAG: patatin-like phospholipase family protein, partial [Planctomycetota bacterium]|nr:patatin-like phospholipase family protein [Planctomycetota bacterium]
GPDAPASQYLASESLKPASLPWASAARKAGPTSAGYQSLCLVHKDSPLKSLADLRAAAGKGQVQFLLVDPLSISGAIVPLLALKSERVPVEAGSVEYSYSHARSLELLRKGPAVALPDGTRRERVALVFDGASSSEIPDPAMYFRAVEVPALAAFAIPQDVWVARAGFEHAGELKQWLLQHRDRFGAAAFADRKKELAERYRPVEEWMAAQGHDSDAPLPLDQVVSLLRHYARLQGKPPRLALVLSGGGAKCAYQVGAVVAMEQRLAQLRAQNPGEEWLDFKVVVGTSGGALNALPVAMRLERTPQGQEKFAAVWKDLDLRDMVRPSGKVCSSIGVWLACVYVALWLLIRHFLAGWKAQTGRRYWAGFWLVPCVLALFTVVFLPWTPSAWLTNRAVCYLGAWLSFGQLSAILSLPFVGLVAYWGRRAPGGPRRVGWILAVAVLLLLPLLSTVLLFLCGPTLFGGFGMERVIARSYGKLIDCPGAGLPELSRRIIDGRMVKRDLVITGNCLPPAVPSDRYFYLAGSARDNAAEARPSFGRHGVPVEQYPERLLDIVMGSGTIYPLFPARALRDFPKPGMQAELIDGGFAHNSPIEAAVLWGATHVVLIEASPLAEQQAGQGCLATNVGDAFNYLYDQSQLADVRSREKVVVFTLRPKPPHLFMLDFAAGPIQAAIARGQADAEAASFRRQPGEPRFVDPGAR